MASLPTPPHDLAALVYRWRESQQKDPFGGGHLGPSLIGRPCERELWFSFRRVVLKKFHGRVLRLFDRGQREEAVVIQEFEGLGCEVHALDASTGSQFKVEALGGHVVGYADLVLKGLPEAPKTYHCGEIKTHNLKSFTKLKAEGVRKAKPEHWSQLVLYMQLLDLPRGLYIAVCKDNDELYFERVKAEPTEALKLLARAERIIFSAEPPPRISEDPAWYQCRFCDKADFCHGRAFYPAVNCRTCLHSTPEREGEMRWSCNAWPADEIPLENQRTGCERHAFIPALLGTWATAMDATESGVVYQIKGAGEAPESYFENGPAGIPSEALVKVSDPRAVPLTAGVLDEFPGAEVEA
jgi:hypothetical protein